MSGETEQGDHRTDSPASPHEQGSTVHVTDVETQGDNVQTETVSETEERPKLTNDSAGERHKEEDELEMTEEEPIDTKAEESQNAAMSPDHGNPSHETTQSSQETDAAIPNEDHGDIVTDIDQETQACIESLKVDGDGDGSHRLDREAPDRQTDPVGPTSNYRSCLEYSLILEQLTEERAQAEERCKSLQMKLAPILAKEPREEVERLVQGEGDTARYEECLRRLTEIKMRMKEEREEAERRAVELREQAQRRLSKVDQEWREVLSLKKDVALTVLSRHMVRAEAQLRVDSALAWEQQQQEALTRLRLQNLRLDSRIHRLQQEIQEADRNATNPFQRQYERLQTRTSERKRRRQRRQQEARGAQARLLQRLQMQSHTKQRLQNTETQIQHQREKLAEVDAILAQRRDALTRVKRAVSSLQKDRGRLREQCGLMGNVVLLKDYHSTQQAIAALEGKLQELKCRQADLEFDFEQRKNRFQTI